jgi:hypothetical protein
MKENNMHKIRQQSLIWHILPRLKNIGPKAFDKQKLVCMTLPINMGTNLYISGTTQLFWFHIESYIQNGFDLSSEGQVKITIQKGVSNVVD